jgi:hypothetical protein
MVVREADWAVGGWEAWCWESRSAGRRVCCTGYVGPSAGGKVLWGWESQSAGWEGGRGLWRPIRCGKGCMLLGKLIGR